MPTTIEPRKFLTSGDVALRIRVSPATVRAWERAGKLAAIRTASGVRLFEESLIARLEAERAGG